MLNHTRRAIIARITRYVPAALLIMAPAMARAGMIQSLHSVLVNAPPSISKPTNAKNTATPPRPAPPENKMLPEISKGPVTLGVNDKGDMAIQSGDVSVIMGYTAPNDPVAPKEDRLRIAQIQKQEVPSINGVSVKVNVIF